jgi:hypothetical protein
VYVKVYVLTASPVVTKLVPETPDPDHVPVPPLAPVTETVVLRSNVLPWQTDTGLRIMVGAALTVMFTVEVAWQFDAFVAVSVRV